MRKILKLAMTPVALALLMFSVVSLPASAHQTEISHGNDFAITATNHGSGSVCDMERDGNYVEAYWYDEDGIVGGAERDGGDPGCDEVFFSGLPAESVVLCEIRGSVPNCNDRYNL